MLYTVIDVETAGLNKYKDSIHSFSYVLMTSTGSILKAETLYFWKEGVTNWSQEAYEVHGLSKEFLRQYEGDFEKNLKKMAIILKRANVMGYNSGYISKEGYLAGFDLIACLEFLKKFELADSKMPVDSLLDLMSVVRKVTKRNIKLSEAVEKYGISEDNIKLMTEVFFQTPNENFHSSAYDVMATVLLYLELAKRGVIYVKGLSAEKETSGVRYKFTEDMNIYDTVDDVVINIRDFKKLNPEMLDRMLNDPDKYIMEV